MRSIVRWLMQLLKYWKKENAAETLRYVSDVIRNSTTVQVKEKLAESFKENFS